MMAQPNRLPGEPYQQLKERVQQHLNETSVKDKIFGVVKDAYSESLHAENIILSRTENNRLLRDILKDVLAEMQAEL